MYSFLLLNGLSDPLAGTEYATIQTLSIGDLLAITYEPLET